MEAHLFFQPAIFEPLIAGPQTWAPVRFAQSVSFFKEVLPILLWVHLSPFDPPREGQCGVIELSPLHLIGPHWHALLV